jgi:lysophospholipase L1-like esterase
MTLDMSADASIFHNVFKTKIHRPACRLLALPLLSGLVACSGSASAPSPAPQPSPAPPAILHPALKLVGVGDSLTAGEQSGGLVGVASSAMPNAAQTRGFWALIWNRANGGNLSSVQTSPLPLMKAPGLLTYLTMGNDFPTQIQDACEGFNASAFSAATALQARANPNVSPYDVGVPGQTVHEALYATAPSATGPTGTGTNGSFACSGAIPPMSTQVAAQYNAENTTFYPILATFGSNITQVQAAASLHGEIATVWLGQNDQIKPLLVPGGIAPTPPEQFGLDITQIIRTLQQSGAKVVIANLMDELHPAAFVPQPKFAAALVRLTSQTAKPIDPSTAAVIAQKIDAFLLPYGVGSGGYVTFPELLTLATHLDSPSPPPLGSTISDKLAAQEHTLNTAYNTQIAAAVVATGAALVDMHAFEAQTYAAGGIAITPTCCTTEFGGGRWSLDGIHPSNTFYAILANRFIGVIDKAFGKTLSPFSPAALAANAADDPFAPK